MIRATLLSIAAATLCRATWPTVFSETQTVLSASSISPSETCWEIANSISAASEVYDIGSPNYEKDIKHWASSSTQIAACSFEPGTPEDVAVALRILGQTRTPFAVKGGGHATNPGFSSTEGVHIAMSRFSDIVYDPTTQLATIGAGLIWDDVYATLEQYGVNVVGARASGIGVAGFTLGGGYSWHTNQYGLTIDTVEAFELVAPNGTVMDVTETSSPDLFFALKGGMNNFGIVTRFTLKTFPQTKVWGGFLLYAADVVDLVSEATATFAADITDPKAAIIVSYNCILGRGGASAFIFYDGPTPPPGIFEEFLALPSSRQDISTRSFSSFVKSAPAGLPPNTRAVFNSISVTDYSLPLLQAIANESIYWGENLKESVFLMAYNVAPFVPTLLSHNTTPTAFPPDRTKGFIPFGFSLAWQSPESDELVYDAVRKSAKTLQAHLVEAGQSDVAHAAVYPNYAVFDTPLIDLYDTNLPRLQAIRAEVDPGSVMDLAGGFKI